MTSILARLASRPHQASAVIWITMFVFAGFANLSIHWADAAREQGSFDLLDAVINEGSSIAISLCMLPMLLAACHRWPISLDNWKTRLPLYLLGSIAWTLLHVTGMVVIRTLIHAALGREYDYGPWAGNLLYEYGKDAQTFFLIVTVAHAFAWYARLRQGEAHALSSPDEGVPKVPESTPDRPQRFLVRKLGREFLIATDDIEWLQASGNYVNLHLGRQAYPLRSTIGGIESQLDGGQFVRVHRSHIVNLRFIASIESTDAGDAIIHMKDGAAVPCSRTYRTALRQEISVNASA